MVHLNNAGTPILSGTAFAGALRAQAERILQTENHPQAVALIDSLFGDAPECSQITKKPVASRLWVPDAPIQSGRSFRATRNRINRITQATVRGALYDAEPCVQGKVTLPLIVRPVQPTDVGLILLALRDLLESLMTLGGEVSVGRGVVQGQATFTLPDKTELILKGDAQQGARLTGTPGALAALETLYLIPLWEPVNSEKGASHA
jgi:CRISPR/Cas system CMR subunit Cmr4 (Cas7 group RAMP superfamily)